MKTKNIIKIELVGEIFYKKRHRVNFKNRTVFDPAAKEKKEITARLYNLFQEYENLPIKKNVPVRINLTFFFMPTATETKSKSFIKKLENQTVPYLKKPDKDNLEKFYLDCMNKIAYFDDNQVYAGCVEKYYTNKHEHIKIEIIEENHE